MVTPVSTPTANSGTAPSAAILNKAQDKVKKYDCHLTRLKITEEFEKRTNGKMPYDWQLNATEALLLGLDCVVVAGTGAGKTMPFMMPLLVYPKKHVIVISPLDALENDQVSEEVLTMNPPDIL